MLILNSATGIIYQVKMIFIWSKTIYFFRQQMKTWSIILKIHEMLLYLGWIPAWIFGTFIFYLIENYKVKSEIPDTLRGGIAEKHLSFFIDAYFDKSNQKWFWGNKNEIQADQWVYKCSNLPHQPATDLVVTIQVTGNLHMPKLNFLFIWTKFRWGIKILSGNRQQMLFERGCFDGNRRIW